MDSIDVINVTNTLFLQLVLIKSWIDIFQLSNNAQICNLERMVLSHELTFDLLLRLPVLFLYDLFYLSSKSLRL